MASAYCSDHRRQTKPLYYRDDKGSFKRAEKLVICCETDPEKMHVDIEKNYTTIPYTKENWDKIQKGVES